ncbi:MAG: hypothetical protein FJ311_04835 [Rhodospirillales bacterium]|nr:hypothetical protein [Rhodospirillales bacterium]
MIKLGMREPVWLDLADGARLKVRPITTPAYAMIQAQAEKVYEDWARHKAGSEDLDPEDPSVRRGLMRALMIKGLALYAVVEWEGIEGPVTDESVAAFVDENPLLAALFYHRYLAPLEDRAAEGNASGPAPHGTSAAGPDTAAAAGTAASPAVAPAPTDSINP